MIHKKAGALWSKRWRLAAIDQLGSNLLKWSDSGDLYLENDVDLKSIDVAAYESKQAAAAAVAESERIERESIKGDQSIKALLRMSQVDLETYIDGNVTTLAGARAFLKRLAAVVKVLAENEFR